MWQKLGLVFGPDGSQPWQASHAQLPTPGPLHGDVLRVYYASRTPEQRSHVGWADVELGETPVVRAVSPAPVLAPGPIGHFDEHGVFPASVVEDDAGRLLMYYVGWTQGVTPPLFYASIGLAISEDGGNSFTRVSPAPVMSRSPYDPCLVTSPCVFRIGSRWRMVYVSGTGWTRSSEETLQSHYHLKAADSVDGMGWVQRGEVAIDFSGPEETNIARASVLQLDQGRYAMWYSYVKHPPGRYRIGFATSPDGHAWTRRDDAAGIGPSPSGFDDEMLCYPQVIRRGDRLFMLYNGNRFGAAGFAMATARIADVAAAAR